MAEENKARETQPNTDQVQEVKLNFRIPARLPSVIAQHLRLVGQLDVGQLRLATVPECESLTSPLALGQCSVAFLALYFFCHI